MAQINRLALTLSMALFLASCGKGGFQTNPSLDFASKSDGQGTDGPAPTPPVDDGNHGDTPAPPITLPGPTPFKFEALSWEKARAEGKDWSNYTFNLLQGAAKDILSAQDMNRFCKRYSFLDEMQKVNVAGQLISGIVKYESGYNPLSRMKEGTMGTDPVTGLPVYSEGLMQLSYQDTQWATFCAFNWLADKNLKVDDPKKTILDPYKNLYCGMRILANQVKKKGFIVLSSGVYWAVIKENGRYEKIDEIAAIVGSLKMCQ